MGDINMTIDKIYEAIKSETCIKSYQIEKEKADNLTIFDSNLVEFHTGIFQKSFQQIVKAKN